MNFFGHALIATEMDDDPRFVFGAMTPDFSSMSRTRIRNVRDETLAAGIAFHHRTDDAFHGTAAFIALCRDGAEELRRRGLDRGSSQAVAHVGTELLLDGVLLDHDRATSSYLGAIREHDPDAAQLEFRDDEAQKRFARLHERLLSIGLPNDYRSPERVAFRLEQILRSRRRLKLEVGDEERMLPWLGETRSKLRSGLAEALLESVREVF